jgi:hypothetical protein
MGVFRFSGSTPLFSNGICSGIMLQRSIFLFNSQGLMAAAAAESREKSLVGGVMGDEEVMPHATLQLKATVEW